MKKITISILAMTLACPAMANITKENTSPTCNNDTIGATSGTTNLQANWTANTINLDWDPKNGGSHGSSTCSYDGGITLQSTPTAPTGYVFAGWQVKLPVFDLSTLAEYLSTNGTANGNAKINGGAGSNEEQYGLTLPGEWATEFDYGIVKGMSRCSFVGEGYTTAQIGTPTDDYPQEGSVYCWCQPTGFDAEKNGTYLSVSSSSWIFYSAAPSGCGFGCAAACSNALKTSSDFRRALFGVSQ